MFASPFGFEKFAASFLGKPQKQSRCYQRKFNECIFSKRPAMCANIFWEIFQEIPIEQWSKVQPQVTCLTLKLRCKNRFKHNGFMACFIEFIANESLHNLNNCSDIDFCGCLTPYYRHLVKNYRIFGQNEEIILIEHVPSSLSIKVNARTLSQWTIVWVYFGKYQPLGQKSLNFSNIFCTSSQNGSVVNSSKYADW